MLQCKFLKPLFLLFLTIYLSTANAIEVPIYDFSIKPYSQTIEDHLPSSSMDYTKPLLNAEYQTKQFQQFYNHYYASDEHGLSPWSEQMVKAIFPFVRKIEFATLNDFDNQNKPSSELHYGLNFKEHDALWLSKIKQNMNLASLSSTEFNEKNKAITVVNTFARALPDDAPDFFHFSLPGQGFPFDNLQQSVVWAATPLYVFGVSQDKTWSLVLTPDAYFAWVKSSDIAYVTNEFITEWQTAAKKGSIAITKTNTPITDTNEHVQFTGYIGAIFPFYKQSEEAISILIPIKNAHQEAEISHGIINRNSGTLMPLAATKENMVKIIKQLQNRPYGWGGAFFFNDCSQELKSIFAPFGIWLPRNSAQQARLGTVNLSKKNLNERINILQTEGHPLMTLIYIGGHVMLYIGTTVGHHHEMEAMTYQNVWGLAPANRDKRYVIGQSVFLPLLKYYPENPEINSLANKDIFKLVYLDQLDSTTLPATVFVKQFTTIPLLNGDTDVF